jgi:hypothetical protein
VVRALLWKEWREQAAIVVALLALGGGVIAAAVQFGGVVTDAGPFEFRGYGESGRLAFLMLALTAGTVIGGALFAGEHEAETAGVLEALPATRLRLWRGKVAAGYILAAAAGAVLIAEGLALGAAGPGKAAAPWATWVGVLTLAAFGWGTFGSVICRSTLAACGTGLFTATFAGCGFLVVAKLITELVIRPIVTLPRGDMELELLVTAFFLMVAPLGLSAAIYAAPDRARRDSELTPGAVGTTRQVVRETGRRRSGLGVRALMWLLYRQYFAPAIILGGLALMFGSVLLADSAPMLVGWPAATLFFGVLVGVTGWADEQGKRASVFWGERRLPVGRLWLAKVVWGLGLSVGLAVLYLLPSLIRELISDGHGGAPVVVAAFRSGLLAGDEGLWTGRPANPTNFLYFVLIWPVYGFAAGHLAGLLFRKAIVAAGVGVLAGGTLAALWLPSFFGGGLHHWQLWPVPLTALLTTLLLIRSWSGDRLAVQNPVPAIIAGLILIPGFTAIGAAAGYWWPEIPDTDRFLDFFLRWLLRLGFVLAILYEVRRIFAGHGYGSRRPMIALVTGIAIIFGLTAAGLARRISEVPVIPEADDDLKFAATIPSYEDNEAGREILGAIGQFNSVDQVTLNKALVHPLFNDDPAFNGYGVNGAVQTYRSRLPLFPKYGWPTDGQSDLDNWLDAVFKDGWDKPLFEAAQKPLGVVSDPTTLTFMSPVTAVQPLREMAAAMLARGLQLQARGDPAAFVRYLDATLALARNSRNKAIWLFVATGRSIEFLATTALDRWLERLNGRPDLLRQALAVLARHEATVPTDPAEVWLAERTLVRSAVSAPSAWADKYLAGIIEHVFRRPRGGDAAKTRAELEASLLGFCWTVPWEKERLRRVVGLGNDPHRSREVEDLTTGAPGLFVMHVPSATVDEPRLAAARRAAILRAALRLFQAETGRPAGTLDELVARRYVPAVPADPFDGRPFRYRVSAGEKVQMEFLPPSATVPDVGGPDAPDFPLIGLKQELRMTASRAHILELGSVVGGWVCSPLPAQRPPGLEPPAILSESEFDAQAAVAGGVVQWPLDPLAPDVAASAGAFDPGRPAPSEVEPGGPSRRMPPPAQFHLRDRRIAEIAPGQAILWSVGPDRIDDDGKVLADRGGYGTSDRGDLVFIVPLPAGKQLVPSSKKEK